MWEFTYNGIPYIWGGHSVCFFGSDGCGFESTVKRLVAPPGAPDLLDKIELIPKFPPSRSN
jgi:hypothetical protein